MITELTQAQMDRFPEFVKRRTDIGLCTEPANRAAAEEGVREAYKQADLKVPKFIVWCNSPPSMGLVRAISQVAEEMEDAVLAAVQKSVEASSVKADTAVTKFVAGKLRKALGISSSAVVDWSSLHRGVFSRLWTKIPDTVLFAVKNSIKVTKDTNDTLAPFVMDSVIKTVRSINWDEDGAEMPKLDDLRTEPMEAGKVVGWAAEEIARKLVREASGFSAKALGTMECGLGGGQLGIEVFGQLTKAEQKALLDGAKAPSKSLTASIGQEVGLFCHEFLFGVKSQADLEKIVKAALDEYLKSETISQQVWKIVENSIWNSGYGQHDAHWLGFYDYFREVCGLEKETEKLKGLWQISKAAGWFFPRENVCFISERHNVLHRNSRGQLHCENGPALAYPDGFCIYALNGVRMQEHHITTPSSRMDAKELLAETNVEVRRELLRKIGIERFEQVAGSKVLDTKGNYQLLSIKLSDNIPDARFLKMLNPSIGVYHIEGVGPECQTVQQAINWRAGDINTDWVPEKLT